ncbi:hypothetical protein EYZ11_012364 [Aspergillus tanneri]|uniref:Uncharacterized protein n=1 Tax=Aspergillus tanneri TaxID=1220188 RepID=A0A4S3J109_9EURO|nr:uncharacterized protein ATNIH1004_010387 [Aspergillus tanneri]KAA8643618.1 hypothetical protein ATNIH1004_010387 [Aspergillus tanneri]THC88192.1 hypothetical protein EYZ11_012364 [Aspergillus tanneri]
MYSRVLRQIDEEHAGLVSKILQWLAYSTRPLYIEEVAEIATINSSQRFSDPRRVLELLPSPLVTKTYTSDESDSSDFKEHQQQLHLVHPSFKEYLLSSEIQTGPESRYAIDQTESHAAISEDCLKYLLQFNQPYTTVPDVVQSSSLLRYAANYWAVHARHAGSRISRIQPLIWELFAAENAYLNWTAFLDGYQPFNEHNNIDGDALAPPPNPLYYASSYGLASVAQDLLQSGAPVDSQGPSGTALAAASLSGHNDTVRLLIDNGADVNSEGPLGRPLDLAASNGHFQVVEHLLERGAK